MANVYARLPFVSALLFLVVFTVALLPRTHVNRANEDASTSQAGMSAPVARVFERSCKDCHSNRIEWPWYSKIPPLSLAIAADVKRGRSFFNLSEWSSYSTGRKRGFLLAIETDLKRDKMPPKTYRWMHWESALTERDRSLLANWAREEGQLLRKRPPSLAKSNASVPR